MSESSVVADPMRMHDPGVLLDVTRRLLDLHVAGSTTLADEVYENPVSVYLDRARFEQERQTLFREYPLVAGFSVELTEPGSFKTLNIAGVPVLVNRDSSGKIRAFLNVCRHRGATLVEGTGCARRFTCTYHSWVYDTEGTLVGLPGAEGFAGMDREERGLVELPVEERHGLIWLLATPGGSLNLDEHLGPLDAELAELGLGNLSYVGTQELPAACNWHVAMDTHTESYHFSSLHRDSIGPFTMSNLNVVERFGASQRLGFGGASLPTLADLPEDEWEPANHIQFVYLLFPNCSLLVTGDHCELFQVMPGPTVDTQVTLQSYYNRAPLDSPEVIASTDFFFEMFHGVVRDEDYPTAEGIQRGLASGANSHLVFGRNEPALHYMHRSYDELLKLS